MQFIHSNKKYIERTMYPINPYEHSNESKKILDDYSDVQVAYSLRKLRSAYTGHCIRVRRSTDDALLDIGFSNGVLDKIALENFVGLGNGYVQIWYDQSHNGINAFGSGSDQPIVVLNGIVQQESGNFTIVSDGSKYLRWDRAPMLMPQPNTYFFVAKSTVKNNAHYFDGSPSSGNRNTVGTYGGQLCVYAGGIYYEGAKKIDRELIYALFNGSSSKISRNNNSEVTGDAGTSPTDTLRLMSGIGSNNCIEGNMQEFIMFRSDKSSEKNNLKNDMNSYYSIY